jgi:hypothetical protein
MNHNFFARLSNKSCYWAGFLCGRAYFRTDSFKIIFPQRDIRQLHRLRRDLDLILDIEFDNQSGNPYIEVFSEKIASDLRKKFNLGAHNNRPNRKFRRPDLVHLSHVHHFIGGYFNAKGHKTYIGCSGNYYHAMRFTGPKNLLSWVQRQLKISKRIHQYGNKCNSYIFSLHGTQALNIQKYFNVMPRKRLRSRKLR